MEAACYHLTWAADRPFVYLDTASGRRVAELFALSSVHSRHGLDDTVRIGEWRAEAGDGVITVTLDAESSVWDAKRYIFECYPDRFRYRIVVEGRGAITDARYLGGYYSGSLKWGTGFFMSGQYFLEGFNPEPTRKEIYTFPINGATTIDLTGTSLPGREDWFFTPPPFCYAFQLGESWLGIGVEAAMFVEMYRAAAAMDWHYADAGWVLETNTAMAQLVEALSAHVYKRHRFYQRALSPAAAHPVEDSSPRRGEA